MPIAVGAGDTWPAAHYWYNYALRACEPDTMAAAGASKDFSDPCFEKAGTDLAAFLGDDAVPGRLPGRTGAAGRHQLGRAARQRGSGDGADGPLAPGRHVGARRERDRPGHRPRLVPVPADRRRPGQRYSALGGGDGFSCSADAPPECVDFLQYILSVDVQRDYAKTGAGLPVTQGSEAGVSDPNMAGLLAFRNKATYSQLWLDVAYGSAVGGALNDAIAEQFAGTGSAAAWSTR